MDLQLYLSFIDHSILTAHSEEMNISSEIFPADGYNFFHGFFFNVTKVEIGFAMISVVEMITLLLGFPINSYVIWLIVTGTGMDLQQILQSQPRCLRDFFCIESAFSVFQLYM